MVGVQRDQDGGWLECMQRRVGFGQFLKILAVVIFVGIDPDAAAQAGHADCRQQMGQRGRSQDRQADLFRWKGRRTVGEGSPDGFIQRVRQDEIQAGIGQSDEGIPGAGWVGRNGFQPQAPVRNRRKPMEIRHKPYSPPNSQYTTISEVTPACLFVQSQKL